MNFAKKILLALAVIAILTLPFLAVTKAQAIIDWWKLRNYTAPAAVSSLAQQDTMTPLATHIFYVNHPDIESNVARFRQDCTVAEQAIVLGCYHSDQDGIYIYEVTNAQLDGVEQVTAAHEMLHGAYDRLSTKERNYIDGLLENYYKSGLKDQSVIDEINLYKQTEPNDVVNEMHSVFGTEVANLPAPLESYYRRYFTNRSVITTFASNYETEFTSRQSELNGTSTQLNTLRTQIDNEEDSLNSQLSQINTDKTTLDSERSSGQTAAYNAGIANYNHEVNVYNNALEVLKNDIAMYNQLVNSYNSLASELAALEKSIDTRVVPQAAP